MKSVMNCFVVAIECLVVAALMMWVASESHGQMVNDGWRAANVQPQESFTPNWVVPQQQSQMVPVTPREPDVFHYHLHEHRGSINNTARTTGINWDRSLGQTHYYYNNNNAYQQPIQYYQQQIPTYYPQTHTQVPTYYYPQTQTYYPQGSYYCVPRTYYQCQPLYRSLNSCWPWSW